MPLISSLIANNDQVIVQYHFIHMNLKLSDSLANWNAGGPLPKDVLVWAQSVQGDERLIATHRSIDDEIMLGAGKKRDGQRLILEACKSSAVVRARIMIVLSNGRTIAQGFDLLNNKLLNEFQTIERTPAPSTGPFQTLTSVPHRLNPGIDTKELKIDCSEDPTRGDIRVTMDTKGLVGYYTFDRIPTKLITVKVEDDEKAPRKVIGEEPYPVLHFWDYLHGRPLSVHIKRFLTKNEDKDHSIAPCIVGSLSGGIPVYAELTPELLEMYQKMYEPKADQIRSQYPSR